MKLKVKKSDEKHQAGNGSITELNMTMGERKAIDLIENINENDILKHRKISECFQHRKNPMSKILSYSVEEASDIFQISSNDETFFKGPDIESIYGKNFMEELNEYYGEPIQRPLLTSSSMREDLPNARFVPKWGKIF